MQERKDRLPFIPDISTRIRANALIKSGFLDRTQAYEVLRSWRKWVTEEFFSTTNLVNLSKIKDVVPNEAKVSFINSPELPEILGYVENTDFSLPNAKFTLYDLKLLSSNNIDFAKATLLFLDIVHDDKFFGWIDQGPNSRNVLVNSILDLKKFLGLYQLRESFIAEREEFFEKFSFNQFVILSRSESFRGLGVKFFIDQPEIASLVSEAITLQESNLKEKWSKRLLIIYRYLIKLDLAQVPDRDIDKLILSQYHGPKDEMGNDFELIARLRANVVDTEGLMAARDYLKSSRQIPNTSYLIEKFRQKIEARKIHLYEREDNPLSHLRAKTGFEIEQQLSKNVEGSVYNVLDILGIKKGGGGIETSPGPFVYSETAILTFLLLVKSGLVDMNSSGHGIHYNIGVLGYDGMNEFCRLLQATGWSSDLFAASYQGRGSFTRGGEKKRHYLRIFHKNHKNGSYREMKEFMLLTAPGFVSQLRYGASMATALNAYQAALTDQMSGQKMQSFINNEDDHELVLKGSKRTLSINEIEKTKITPDQKALAFIWVVAMNKLYRGFDKAKIDHVLYPSPLMKHAVDLAKAVSGVFPDRWSRYSVDPRIVNHLPIDLDGKKYPNVVTFARSLCREMHDQVEAVLYGAEIDFLDMMNKATTAKALLLRNRTVEEIFVRFPCGLSKKADFHAKERKFHELKKLYGI